MQIPRYLPPRCMKARISVKLGLSTWRNAVASPSPPGNTTTSTSSKKPFSTLCLVNSLMRAMGDKAAITPLTESVEHVGWCRKTAMVFVICLKYKGYVQIKKRRVSL